MPFPRVPLPVPWPPTLLLLEPPDVGERLLGGRDEPGAALLHSALILVLLVEPLVMRHLLPPAGGDDAGRRLKQRGGRTGQATSFLLRLAEMMRDRLKQRGGEG